MSTRHLIGQPTFTTLPPVVELDEPTGCMISTLSLLHCQEHGRLSKVVERYGEGTCTLVGEEPLPPTTRGEHAAGEECTYCVKGYRQDRLDFACEVQECHYGQRPCEEHQCYWTAKPSPQP